MRHSSTYLWKFLQKGDNMLERDYILEVIETFVDTVAFSLRGAFIRHNPAEAQQTEHALAELMDLDAKTAFSLSPESLVTMMHLSGIGDATASYVSYTLGKLADAYERMGEKNKGEVRRAQARAVAVAFGWQLSDVPKGMELIDADLKD